LEHAQSALILLQEELFAQQVVPLSEKADRVAVLAIAYHKLVYALGYDLNQIVIGKPKVEAPEEIKALAQQRWNAKQAKDWATADQVRDELQSKGYKILDSKDGFEIEQL
ncbi:MAG: hypothetical protein HOJ89_00990, partial [Opitutales bacterium]|nr:hypothetical protein [Opitutales bacterium]